MATNTWIASSAGNASTDANWSLGHAPLTGEDVVFDGTSVNNCLWDIAATTAVPNSITLAAGYTGTVTQGDVDIGIGAGGWTQYDGRCVGRSGYEIIINGNYFYSSSTANSDQSLHFIGDELELNLTGKHSMNRLSVDGSLTFSGSTIPLLMGLYVGEESELFIAKGVIVEIRAYSSTYENHGSISGTGDLIVYFREDNTDFVYGNLAVNLQFVCHPVTEKNAKLTVTSDNAFGGNVTIYSLHPTYTASLDLNGHSLTARGITVGTRGVLLGGEGVIRNYGNFDSSAGTWTPESCQYVQAGSGTIKMAAGHSFNDLIVESKAAGSSLASNVTVNGIYAHVPDLIQGAYSLTYNKDTEYTGKRRPLRKRIVKRVVWPSLADKELLEDLEAAP